MGICLDKHETGCNLQYHIEKCVHTYTVHLLNHDKIYQPHYINNCLCNEVAGLELRSLQHHVIPKSCITKFRIYINKYYHYFMSNDIGSPATYKEIIDRYTCSKKKRYIKAYNDILCDGLDYYFDAKVNTFVKVAKFNIDSKWDTKQNKLCRTVNTRSYKFTLELLRYIHPIEEVLMNYTYNGYPCIAKGKSMKQRAQDIWNIFYSFADPVVLSLDLTGFDMHITKQMLKEEFKLYNKLYGNTKDIRRLTSAMLVNNVTTEHGIKRRIRGQRMSGDATTACGNVIQMTCILQVAMEGFDYKFYDDGDDCLLFIESRDFQSVKTSLLATYSAFGHELKLENVAHEYSDIVFCQCRPFEDSLTGELNMIPDPWKVLSQMTSHYRYYNQPHYGIRMFKTIMFGYASIYQHVPIIAKYAARFLRIFEKVKMVNIDDTDNEHYYWFKINNVNFKNKHLLEDIENSIYTPDLTAFLDFYYDMTMEDIDNLTYQIDKIDPAKLNFKFRECGSGYYGRIKYS